MKLREEYEEFQMMNAKNKGDKKYERRKQEEFKALDLFRKNQNIEALKLREREEAEERQIRN